MDNASTIIQQHRIADACEARAAQADLAGDTADAYALRQSAARHRDAARRAEAVAR